MSKRWGLFISVLLVVLTGLSTLAGCGANDVGNYKEFSLTEGVAHFYFQYPSYYTVRDMDIRGEQYNAHGIHSAYSTHVYIGEPFSEESEGSPLEDYQLIPLIRISVDGRLSYIYNYEEILEEKLERYKKDKSDYRLLSREPVIVDGKLGEQIVYFLKFIVRQVDPEKPCSLIVREAHFDYGGLLWEISMHSLESAAEADKAVFEHIIKTFQIFKVDLEQYEQE